MTNNKFDQWIFESYSPSAPGLALYRIFASLLFLFFLLPDFGFYSTLASYPDDFFTPPPGPMMLFDSFPPAWFLQMIHLLLIFCWVCVLVGIKTKLASLMAGVFMLIIQGYIFSLGKVNHEILLSVTPIVMAFTNWGAAFSYDSFKGSTPKKTEGWPLVLLALFIGFMMFTAGLPKILGGWLDPSTQAAQGHLFNQYYVRGRQELLSGFAVQIDSALIWEILDWATILFEAGFLIAVLKAGWFRLFVCFAVIFHFSTMMMLNIAFLANFMAYAAFFKWESLYRYLWRVSSGNQDRDIYSVLVILISGLIVFFGTLRWASEAEIVISYTEPSLHHIVLISLFLIVVIVLAIRKLRVIFSAS